MAESMLNKKGIDISEWNGDINLKNCQTAGFKFVMIRCGAGNTYDDPQFSSSVQKAEKLGMPWGVYLFSYASSTSDAKAELSHIDRLLKAQKVKGYKPTMPIAIDIEWTQTLQDSGGWNASNVNNVATIILDGLAALKYYPIIYTGYSELAWCSSHIQKDYDHWFAQWSTKPSLYAYKRMGIWQYGGETNYIDGTPYITGVSGPVDKNVCYRNYPAIIKNKGYNGWPVGSATLKDEDWGTLDKSIYIPDGTTYTPGVEDSGNYRLSPEDVDYTLLTPYMITIDRKTKEVDYKKMKEYGVVGTMIEAGYLFDATHKEVDNFRNPKLDAQARLAIKNEMHLAFYMNCRARNDDEARREMYEFCLILDKYAPEYGAWLILNLPGKKADNDKLIKRYYNELIRVGMIHKIGFYVTEKQLEKISWEKHCTDWLLWLNKHVTSTSDFDKLLDPEFFNMPYDEVTIATTQANTTSNQAT